MQKIDVCPVVGVCFWVRDWSWICVEIMSPIGDFLVICTCCPSPFKFGKTTGAKKIWYRNVKKYKTKTYLVGSRTAEGMASVTAVGSEVESEDTGRVGPSKRALPTIVAPVLSHSYT